MQQGWMDAWARWTAIRFALQPQEPAALLPATSLCLFLPVFSCQPFMAGVNFSYPH